MQFRFHWSGFMSLLLWSAKARCLVLREPFRFGLQHEIADAWMYLMQAVDLDGDLMGFDGGLMGFTGNLFEPF
jgi:hypothetical protein